MHSYLISCGVSLLTNYNKKATYEHPELSDLTGFIRGEGWRDSCAELNSLRFLSLQKDDILYLLTSATPDGKLCAAAIRNGLMAEGYHLVFIESVEGLDKKARNFKKRGLVNLINKFVALVQQGEPGRFRLVSTGGFKAQIAYSTLLGILFGIPVYYIHEDFSELVELPPLPLHFDFSSFEDASTEVEGILCARDRKEASRFFNQLQPEMRILFQEKDGGTFELSPLGQALNLAFHARRQSNIRVICQDSHHNLFGTGRYERLSDVPNEEFRRLVQMLKRLYPPITTVGMDTFTPDEPGEPGAEYIDQGPGFVKYKLRLAAGVQVIKLGVAKGYEKKARERIGRKLLL